MRTIEDARADLLMDLEVQAFEQAAERLRSDAAVAGDAARILRAIWSLDHDARQVLIAGIQSASEPWRGGHPDGISRAFDTLLGVLSD